MTRDEIKAMFNDEPSVESADVHIYAPVEAPEAFDWRTENPGCISSKAYDQASCGSCWAFAVVGSLSHTRCIQKADPSYIRYSEQYQTSCDKGNSGCNGGNAAKSLDFLKKTGVVPYSCVAYTSGKNGVTGKCPTTCDDKTPLPALTKIKDFAQVCKGEDNIKAGIMKAPLRTRFDVYDDFMYFSGDKDEIYVHKTGGNVGGHAVQFVGWGELDGTKYWLIKNSWGEGWGNDGGYFKFIRGTNNCKVEGDCYTITP